MRLLIYGHQPFEQPFFEQANAFFKFSIDYRSEKLTIDTVKHANGYDVICAFVHDDLSKPVIDALYDLKVKLIALRSVGYDHVDLKSAAGKIPVVRVPDYSPYAVAEHTAALILSLNRKIHLAYQRTRSHDFTLNGLMGFDLHGKTAGIIGSGKIGKALATILRGFGMRVLLNDIVPDDAFAQQAGASYVDLKTLLQQSDIVSLHCPLNEETHHLINAKTLAMIQPHAMLINTGRGGLVNTSDLICALKGGALSCAGLDVYENEKAYFFEDFRNQPLQDPLLEELLMLPNVIVTAHLAFFTEQAVRRLVQITLENVHAFASGKPLVNEVRYCSRK